MAVNDECILRVIGRFQSQNIVNTMHYRITAQVSNDQSVLQSMLVAWLATNESNWLAVHDDDYELIGLKSFVKSGTAKTPGVLAVNDSGGVVGTAVPAGMCRTITLYTADAKFRRRGRVMLSGADTTMFDATDGSLTTAHITALETLGSSLISQITSVGDEFHPGIPATAVDAWADFVDSKPRETPSMIRSRRVREFLIG